MFLHTGGLFQSFTIHLLFFSDLKLSARQLIRTSQIPATIIVAETSAKKNQMHAVVSRTQFVSSLIRVLLISAITIMVQSIMNWTKVTLFYSNPTVFLLIIWQMLSTINICAFHTLSEVKNGSHQHRSTSDFMSK